MNHRTKVLIKGCFLGDWYMNDACGEYSVDTLGGHKERVIAHKSQVGPADRIEELEAALERVSKKCIMVEGLLSEEIERRSAIEVRFTKAVTRHTIALLHERGKPLRTIVRQRYWGWRKRKA